MAGDDNFAQFVDYVDRNEDILNGTAFAYAPPSRRTLKDRLNPMEAYDEHEFLCRYRFTKSAENADGRKFPLPPLMQLLIALRFYGAGTFQLVSGNLVNVSQPTVSRGITGPDLQFYDVVASWPGSAHDSRIFDSSRARVMYETDAITGIPLGDMSYACRSYLMTPLKDPQRGRPEYRQATPGCTECSAAYIGTTKRTASDGNPRHRRL
ncbi:hypothetical protein HPB52_021645 [Rhipicephalus sanguineus]|uniref:DDE Tnp4 domain-containing protein n=1 Tax=Rhipicephalus sanguineus TaxID=34632 RepID=A0A9D4T0P5_RHISA|nr:hypothetical protein HPB52_021645 [Rhipicephalus sanguineus]